MEKHKLRLVFIGLSITSSWGNGHATTYRALLNSLEKRGHEILFLEYDAPWYAPHRDMPKPSFCTTHLYASTLDLKERFHEQVATADAVITGSYVNDGVNVGKWVQQVARGTVCFYDIDTPVTLAKLAQGDFEYLNPDVIPGYDLYLSFSGGAALEILQERYGSPEARHLYCSVDTRLYYPETSALNWDLGYLGTYSDDRQPGLNALLLEPARLWEEGQFVVAGPQYPEYIAWPYNVQRIEHLPPDQHRRFYNSQKFTLNITRSDMKSLGFSPSVRLFEAAACGIPMISDNWEGLDQLFLPGRDILIAESAEQVLDYLKSTDNQQREAIGTGARNRVLGAHTSDHRAAELEAYLYNAANRCRCGVEGANAGAG